MYLVIIRSDDVEDGMEVRAFSTHDQLLDYAVGRVDELTGTYVADIEELRQLELDHSIAVDFFFMPLGQISKLDI